jgi:hypothetical protein
MPGRPRRRIVASSIALAALVSALSASAATAATVTVGSPLGGGFPSSYFSSGSVATVANVALEEPGAHATSPVNGTIVQWRVTTEGTGQYSLRVLRPTGDHYTGAGTSSQTVSSAGPHTFPASLPIQTGDLVAVDIPDSTDGISAYSMKPGSTFDSWIPPVADGGPSGFADPFPGFEALFNADVQYPDPVPPAPTTSKKCKKKKKHKRSATSAKKKCKKKKKHHAG